MSVVVTKILKIQHQNCETEMTYYLMVAYHINKSIGQSAKMQNAVNRCLATSSVKVRCKKCELSLHKKTLCEKQAR